MLPIVIHPNPILEEEMPAFDFTNPVMDPNQLKDQMLETMFANNGIGLAAPQVGIRARVFVMGQADNKENAQIFFNPEVVEASNDVYDMEEGCLSFPNVYAKIKRPAWIMARYQDADGVIWTSKFEGYDCKCFLHELDHLNGINFKDRLSQLKWSLALKKAKKEKRYVRTK